MREFFKDYANRVAVMMVVGLVLIMAHYADQPFINYVFLPQIGMAILLGTILIALYNKRKSLTLGPKIIWIPLAIISGSAVVRLFVQQDMATLAGALFMSSMFGLYVVCRIYGERTFNLFWPLVIIGAITVIVQAIIAPRGENPGAFSEYATASQFLVFGWIVSPRKYQWWLSGIVIIGLLFSGAEEALFYIAVGGIVILARRDWSRKILLPLGVIVLFIVIATPLGITQTLFGRGIDMIKGVYRAVTDDSLTPEERNELLDKATNTRWLGGWRLHRPVQALGHGINLTYHYKGIPHNIVLLIMDQLGPVAMLAWFAVIIGGIKKTAWKYAYLALLLFGVFQPFVWTKMAPWIWAVAGASTGADRSSYIFRGA